MREDVKITGVMRDILFFCGENDEGMGNMREGNEEI